MAVERYERAAAADSHIRLDALTKLVRLLDRRGYAYQARDAAEKMLEIAPPERAVRLGSSELYRKYLINSAELSPVKYWTIHP
jgi:hypothetical protein